MHGGPNKQYPPCMAAGYSYHVACSSQRPTDVAGYVAKCTPPPIMARYIEGHELGCCSFPFPSPH
jgi:hypothetical protein